MGNDVAVGLIFELVAQCLAIANLAPIFNEPLEYAIVIEIRNTEFLHYYFVYSLAE